ncbi:MAG: hypothetical protein UT05_C0015G0012 [Parcubacteria group bacterium GW2011_GWF2_38_76]|nr:MAG: hypothetical protein UT05_C0015G0012 [Parcubacteria group bacterium GW2011_GWF2_38_76]
MPEIDYNELKKFLLDANTNGYAGSGNKVTPQRPGFKEIECSNGDWLMHDSYAGHFFAPGQEIVYYKGIPIWTMAYAGGMKFQHHGDEELAHETFVFLKKALLAMDPEKPYRGPEHFEEGEWKYISTLEGDIKDFLGNEKIYHEGELLFEQIFIGGIIV